LSGKIYNYYGDGNTAKGFYSLHKSNIEGLKRLFILKGTSGECKSILIKRIAVEWVQKNIDIELIHSSTDNDFVNGIIIPQLKCGIVDENPIKSYIPTDPETVVKFIELDSICNIDKFAEKKDEFQELQNTIQRMQSSACNSFKDALDIHDEWEDIYIKNMNFSKAEDLRLTLENLIFSDKSLNKDAIIKDRFMGAATPKGPVDFINNLTENISKRYFIKGRPGTGKSTMLKKLAKTSQERGFDVEIYHCGFDPDSLDMLIFRELNIAVFDSTAPHEYFPVRKGDEIIDMYKEAVNPGTDEKYNLELQKIIQRYKVKVHEATNFLKDSKEVMDTLEKLYCDLINFDNFEEIRIKLDLELQKLIKP
jgi:hypothetical protein